MRQIEDQWKVDPKNLPTHISLQQKIYNNYRFSQSEIEDINDYSRKAARTHFIQKCQQLCLKNSNENCVDTCFAKMRNIAGVHNEVLSEFNEKIHAYELAGKNIFQS